MCFKHQGNPLTMLEFSQLIKSQVDDLQVEDEGQDNNLQIIDTNLKKIYTTRQSSFQERLVHAYIEKVKEVEHLQFELSKLEGSKSVITQFRSQLEELSFDKDFLKNEIPRQRLTFEI